MSMSRRKFLKGMTGAVGATVAAPMLAYLPPPSAAPVIADVGIVVQPSFVHVVNYSLADVELAGLIEAARRRTMNSVTESLLRSAKAVEDYRGAFA